MAFGLCEQDKVCKMEWSLQYDRYIQRPHEPPQASAERNTMGIRTISNDKLTVSIETLGAQLKSIKDAQGHEYLWQGDPAYWKGRAYNLFPFVGRMKDQKYHLFGESYEIGCHGFARNTEFSVSNEKDDEVTFQIKDSEETYRQFPYHFTFGVRFRLQGNRLEMTYLVENQDDKKMYFAVGGHPGFFVPMEEGLQFEDYRLEFPDKAPGENGEIKLDPSAVQKVHMSERTLPDGYEPYPLQDGCYIPLVHDMFDNDAVVLKNMPRRVKVYSPKGKRSVTVDFPQMPYVGFWHAVKTDAPYVCVEPWSTLPGWDGTEEDFEKQEDLLHINAGETYENVWSVTVE